MSVLFECDEGWFVSHEEFVRCTYRGKHRLSQSLFDIRNPYKVRKKTDTIIDPSVLEVKENFDKVIQKLRNARLLECPNDVDARLTNEEAKNAAQECTEKTVTLHDMSGVNGGNNSSEIVYPRIGDCDLIIPEHCRFFCGDVRTLLPTMEDKDFDLIVLDPPWWNKYIRRKNTKDPNGSYKMLYNEEIANLPIGNFLSKESLVAVWCTNSDNHENEIKSIMFPMWGVVYVAAWYWVKITKCGETICPFSKEKGKQPFERLIIGINKTYDCKNIPINGKIFVSVPSALHSHKPPLNELLSHSLQKTTPKCLEVFARYLLPHTTSVGFEPLRWQHKCLYTDNEQE